MTNLEKYLTNILAELPWGKFSGEIGYCQNYDCDECDFETGQRSCGKEAMEWLRAEADAEPEIDWSKVPVDTPIWVRDREDQVWIPRYFAKYENGLVYTWYGGATSWSACNNSINSMSWKQAKLAKE